MASALTRSATASTCLVTTDIAAVTTTARGSFDAADRIVATPSAAALSWALPIPAGPAGAALLAAAGADPGAASLDFEPRSPLHPAVNATASTTTPVMIRRESMTASAQPMTTVIGALRCTGPRPWAVAASW